MGTALEPVRPIHVADRFPALGRELLALLRSLARSDWEAPTVCPAWSVRDVAAHLLDTALRRLAFGRDRQPFPPPDGPIDSYAALVAFLNRLNAAWVAAFRRVSPEMLVDLLAAAEPQLANYFATLDPKAPALGVAWAGEETSEQWFDLARELTERWHHQQQIRLAVGAAPLDDPFYVAPVLDTFLRALPHRYREVEAPAGTAIGFSFSGREEYRFTLRRGAEGWTLLYGREPEGESASVAMADETGWLLLTKGLTGSAARDRSRVVGEARWVDPFFETLAVMA
ncbi:MAG TPA: maleylpyruvate isomerase N-terminal domain-containing protein [Thermoanaerobaculia bacterium]|nr:maleylpyruvate isomerase N-terminal domain-containing protein [Thermoanaerobaculia bacterium]